ncbi:MAG TPA: response regulator transcription factor, partial [Beijerinckiaceae bacterium]|nr:response regulator transcription factor [Beijerinckiaceae bacterium]
RLRCLVASSLRQEGFVVDEIGRAEDAENSLRSIRYDLIILDLGLPDMDGMELLHALRKQNLELLILVLTARDSSQALINGLNGGADDFLRKPFDMGELVARIRALLRRPGKPLGVTLTEGNVVFDTVERSLSIGLSPVNLTRREANALEILMRRSGHVVPKRALEESLYGFGQETESNAVEVVVHRLRKKFQAAGSTANIHTLRGLGYAFSGER